MGTLKPQSNGPLYSNKVIRILAVDGWTVTFGTAAPPSPLLAVPNVTVHPSTASVRITLLLYNGPLIGGINVFIKGLKHVVLSSRYLGDQKAKLSYLFYQLPSFSLKCGYPHAIPPIRHILPLLSGQFNQDDLNATNAAFSPLRFSSGCRRRKITSMHVLSSVADSHCTVLDSPNE